MKLPALLLICTLFWAAQVNAKPPQKDSLQIRMDNIELLLDKLQAEIDALKKAISQAPLEPSRDSAAPPGDSLSEPLATELMSSRQKALYRAAETPHKNIAAGISSSPYLPFAFDLVHWFDKWGYKIELGALWQEGVHESVFGARVFALRSLHTFNLFGTDKMAFHLYGFGGAGLNSSAETYWPGGGTPSTSTGPEQEYEKSDISSEILAGAGVEISIPFIGGVRLSPEVGYKASYFFSRYQDSQAWKDQTPGQREEERPDSDFSLNLHFTGNLYFYFK
jgi:hypothetical protein